MARKILKLTGTEKKEYDLDKIESQSRLNSDEELIVQVWKWNPNETKYKDRGRNLPNPPEVKIGQIWLSKLEKDIEKLDAYLDSIYGED